MQYRLLRELRCPKCGKLLARSAAVGTIEIKCARCGFVAKFK